jgi:hypothetical protein
MILSKQINYISTMNNYMLIICIMDKFLEISNLPKLNHREIEKSWYALTSKEIE